MTRDQMQALFVRLFRWLTVTEFYGTEHLPRTGGVLVATNHMSRLDIPLLFINPVRADITALVADKYQRYPFFRWIITAAGAIWLDRNEADFTAFRKAIEELRAGKALGIAPEGTRSEIGQLLPGKPGTALLAERARVPIVPVGLTGTETGMRDLMRLRKPRFVARFGTAFTLPPLERSRREEQLKEHTDEIMVRIAACLPPKYWGAYAGHPRLKELLEEQGQVPESA